MQRREIFASSSYRRWKYHFSLRKHSPQQGRKTLHDECLSDVQVAREDEFSWIAVSARWTWVCFFSIRHLRVDEKKCIREMQKCVAFLMKILGWTISSNYLVSLFGSGWLVRFAKSVNGHWMTNQVPSHGLFSICIRICSIYEKAIERHLIMAIIVIVIIEPYMLNFLIELMIEKRHTIFIFNSERTRADMYHIVSPQQTSQSDPQSKSFLANNSPATTNHTPRLQQKRMLQFGRRWTILDHSSSLTHRNRGKRPFVRKVGGSFRGQRTHWEHHRGHFTHLNKQLVITYK